MHKLSWKISKNEMVLGEEFSTFVTESFAERQGLELEELCYHPSMAYFSLNTEAKPPPELVSWALRLDRSEGEIPFDWTRASLSRQQQQFNSDTGANIELVLRGISSGQFRLLQEGRQALADVWPEARDLESALISHYIGFDAENFWSSSDPSAFGAIFLNPNSDWCMLNYFETIVHELSHHSLMLIDAFEPLLENPMALAPSPLRLDQRPLKGILHAVFVLRRMIEGFDRLLQNPSFIEFDKDKAANMRQQNSEKLKAGLETLSEHAQWTSAGSELFQSLQATGC